MKSVKMFGATVIALTLTAVTPALAATAEKTTAAASATAQGTKPEGQEGAATAATPLAPRAAKPLALAPTTESNTPFGYKMLAGLGIAGAAAFWLRHKRRQLMSKKPSSAIEILSQKSVGAKNELLVVDVEGTRLLIGMTPGAMQTLAILDGDDSTIPAASITKDAEEENKEEIAPPRTSETRALAHREPTEDEDELPPVSIVPPKPRAKNMFGAVTESGPIGALDRRVRSLLDARRNTANTGTSEAETASSQKNTSASPPATATLSSLAKLPTPMAGKRRRSGPTPNTSRIAGQAKGLLLAMEEQPQAEETKPAATGTRDW